MTQNRSRLLVRVAAPGAEPITLAEAKLYLRVDNTEEDTLIAGLISCAREDAEQYLRQSLITQSWKLAFDDDVEDAISFPQGPVQSITSVTLFDKDDNATVFNASGYRLNAAKNNVMFNTSCQASRIEILYTAGYGTMASSVPAPIKQGILLHVAEMYDMRGDTNDTLPEAAQKLYVPFREVRL